MKIIVIIGALLMSTLGFTQNEDITFTQTANSLNGANRSFVTQSNSGTYSGQSFQAAKPIEGSRFLYDKWNQTGTLETNGGDFLNIVNLNFDMERGTFVFREEEKIFDVNQFVVKNITVNGNVFKRTIEPKSGISRLMQVMYETDDYAVLKDNKVDVKRGRPDAYSGQEADSYKDKTKYYKVAGNNFEELKLNKKGFEELFGTYEESMEDFIKINNLSYRDSKHFDLIFNKLEALRQLSNL